MYWDWINSTHISVEYERWIQEIMQFAQHNIGSSVDGVKFKCPCVSCLNGRRLNATEIREHLICDGFLQNFTIWTWHGELFDIVSMS